MTCNNAFSLFESMIQVTRDTLFEFTLNSSLSIQHKADKSAVTACDQVIDTKLTQMAHDHGLQVVSEEGEHVQSIVASGNYLTIDPIDGTLGYIENVNYALDQGDINLFGKEDLGAKSDFCLLLGLVENGQPRFGACFNYLTGEKILLDSSDSSAMIRQNNVRNYTDENVAYFDQRILDDEINKTLQNMPGVKIITQAALGLKSLYTIINPHKNAVTVHRVQTAGLWDIMPAAVAARAFGGEVLDALGRPLSLTQYIILPGTGAIIIKGEMFKFVIEKIKNT